jgi:uncharacterized protein (TIGR00730 family)
VSRRIARICVFCASSPGSDPRFLESARQVGAELARRGVGVVYGGGRVGLMGALADAALAGGGEVIGVIPRDLVDRELAHDGVTDLRVVDSLAERKALMAELADAVIALPGGIGTLDELSEVLSWSQLGLHAKPIGLLDVAGYWQPLSAWLEHAVASEFVAPAHRDLLIVAQDLASLITVFEGDTRVAVD